VSASDVESPGLPERRPERRAVRPGAVWAEARRTPVALTLIVSCVLLWGGAQWWGNGSDSVLWYLGANQGEVVRSGEWYRLLSCLFLHLGGVHLLLNMVALRALSPLESALGHRRFLLLYFFSGLGASLSTALLRPAVLSVGASGAIWGLMGAAFGMRIPTRHVLRARGMRLSAGWPVLAVNLAISFLPGVDLSAHLGGGAVGFVLGATLFYPDYSVPEQAPSRRARVELWAAVLAVLLMAAALLTALLQGQPWRLRQPARLQRVAIAHTGLSLELPELLATEPASGELESASGWRAGGPGRSPLWVTLQRVDTSLEVPESEHGLPAQQLEDWLLQLREQIEREPDDPEVPRKSLQLTTLGPHRFVRDEYRGEDLHAVRYFTYVGPYPLELDVFRISRGEREIWERVEEQIAASLKHAGQER
jgi:rhomboid protease GluP